MTPTCIPLTMEYLGLGPRRILLESSGWTMSMPLPSSLLKEEKNKQDEEGRRRRLTPTSIPLTMECLRLGPRRILLESPRWTISMPLSPSFFLFS